MKDDVFSLPKKKLAFFFLTKKILTNFRSAYHSTHIQVGIAVLKWSAWMTRNGFLQLSLRPIEYSFIHSFIRQTFVP